MNQINWKARNKYEKPNKRFLKSKFYQEKGGLDLYGDIDKKCKLLKMKNLKKSMLEKRINDLKNEIEELEKEIAIENKLAS